MKTALLLVACASISGCSLKDLLAKADDAGAASPAASSAASASSVDPPAPVAAVAPDAGPVAKNAPSPASAAAKKAKGAIPTCAKGQVLGTEALSPFKPFCAATCKTDADCRGVACTAVNALAPDGTSPSGEHFIKVCNPDVPTTAPTAKASAAASAAAPPVTAGKCGPNQHFDDINKKCRAFGDCPKGFRWNDPMKSCVAED